MTILYVEIYRFVFGYVWRHLGFIEVDVSSCGEFYMDI
jgi:hypothetical protein